MQFNNLVEGKAADAIMSYLRSAKSASLTDMARDPLFRKMHFASVQSAAEALAKRGKIKQTGGSGAAVYSIVEERSNMRPETEAEMTEAFHQMIYGDAAPLDERAIRRQNASSLMEYGDLDDDALDDMEDMPSSMRRDVGDAFKMMFATHGVDNPLKPGKNVARTKKFLGMMSQSMLKRLMNGLKKKRQRPGPTSVRLIDDWIDLISDHIESPKVHKSQMKLSLEDISRDVRALVSLVETSKTESSMSESKIREVEHNGKTYRVSASPSKGFVPYEPHVYVNGKPKYVTARYTVQWESPKGWRDVVNLQIRSEVVAKAAGMKESRLSEAKKSPDQRVIDAFIDKKPAESKKLSTDGKSIDGLWMGGKNIAGWTNGKIEFYDLGSNAAVKVQRAIKKAAPKNWIGEARQKWGGSGSPFAGGGDMLGEARATISDIDKTIGTTDDAQKKLFKMAQVVAGKGSEDQSYAAAMRGARDALKLAKKDLASGKGAYSPYWRTQQKNDWPDIRQAIHWHSKASPEAKKIGARVITMLKRIVAPVGPLQTNESTSHLSEKMRQGTEKELQDVLAKAKWPTPRRMFTKRTQDLRYSDRGTEVASVSKVLTRGKVTSTNIMINDDYLSEATHRPGSRLQENMAGARHGMGVHISADELFESILETADIAIGNNERNQRRMMESIEGNVGQFLALLTSKITQADMAQKKRDAKKGRMFNANALGLMLGAKQKIDDAMKGKERSTDPEDLKKLKALIKRAFNPGTSPAEFTMKAIDKVMAGGPMPKITAKGGAKPAWG